MAADEDIRAGEVDGSFMSNLSNDLDTSDNKLNSSVLSTQKLYGIQEQEEFEDPLNSGRGLTADL